MRQSQFADKLCKLRQSERNEVIFDEKRASAYNCTTVEFFVKGLENTMKIHIPYEKKISFKIKMKLIFSHCFLFQGRKERVCLHSETAA